MIAGYSEQAAARMPHTWKAGAQTRLLKRQLEAMPAGGLFVIAVPPEPYRCPPGPYERASRGEHCLTKANTRAKIPITDDKDRSRKDRKSAWQEKSGRRRGTIAS